MKPTSPTTWILTGLATCVAFLVANPIVALIVLAIILLIVDRFLFALLVVGVIIWFAVRVGFPHLLPNL